MGIPLNDSDVALLIYTTCVCVWGGGGGGDECVGINLSYLNGYRELIELGMYLSDRRIQKRHTKLRTLPLHGRSHQVLFSPDLCESHAMPCGMVHP